MVSVTGIDACPGGWVAVTLPGPRADPVIQLAPTLAGLSLACLTGIDMPLGLLQAGWRTADALARGALRPHGARVFAIAPRACWQEPVHAAASARCVQLTGQGLSIQAWGLRERLLDAAQYRLNCQHGLFEVHPELSFAALDGGAPLADSKHTGPGRTRRRALLAGAGIELPAAREARRSARLPPGSRLRLAEDDLLDAAAVAWSARRIADGTASVLTDPAQRADDGTEIAIRY